MGKIHQLGTILANQIAAGEVIEQPAAVVKELIENSLDAHSKQIDVTVNNGKGNSIKVIDNGEGLDADDVALAFCRHATSKIIDKHDLFRIRTLGFRGEALPSIASVADVRLITATSQAAMGRQIHVRGGEIRDFTQTAARPGTTVVVSDLFFNVPARLKYLKSPQTEFSRIIDIVNRLALANPAVAFSLTHNGKELFHTVGNGKLQQVFAAIYGVTVGRKMVPIEKQNTNFKITGLISLPELTRARRDYISIMINHRYVHSYPLTKALLAGYYSKLMVGRYPLAVVDVTIDPLLVDVNIHPTKREIRLNNEEQLANSLKEVVTATLAAQNLIPSFNSLVSPNYQTNKSMRPPSLNSSPMTQSSPSVVPTAPLIIRHQSDLTSSMVRAFDTRYRSEAIDQSFAPTSTISSKPNSLERNVQSRLVLKSSPPMINNRTDQKYQRFPDLEYIGQVHGTYLLAQAEDGLYFIDQHAAQERVNYEYYREIVGQVSTDQQFFLTPLVLSYSTIDTLKIHDYQAIFAEVGLKLAPFGRNSFIMTTHPAWFLEGQEEDTIREMIDWVLQDGKLTIKDFLAKAAIMMACKRAIKANHALSTSQASALLTHLAECQNPFNCPHGRPVIVQLSNRDLEKLFKRIQEPHVAPDGFDDYEV